MFDADAASIILRVMRFVPRKEQPKFLKAMLAHTTAYLCMLEGDEGAFESLNRLADAVINPEVRKHTEQVRRKLHGPARH